MELVDYCFDTRYTDIMSSSSGLYPREAVHRLASPQTSFGVRSSRIHFYPTDGFSYERVAQFNLEWIFSKLDSGFLVLDSGFQSPGFRIPGAKNSWIPESGFPYMGRLHGGDGGGKALFSPFEVSKTSEIPFRAKCLN